MPSSSFGVSFRQHPPDESYDAIVIGSGIGGLAAAALLARHAGRRVLVLERHYTAGGFTHVFRRPGFEWDVGVHYIGQAGSPDAPVRRMFDHLTGGRLAWSPMADVYDRVFLGDRSYDFPSGEERFRERMTQCFPREETAIRRYLEAVRACVRASGLYFAERVVPPFVASLFGGLMRRGFLRLAGRTTAAVLREMTADPELAAVLTAQWVDYGLPPGQSSFGIHAFIVEHYLGGGYYPTGGAAAIGAGVAPAIESRGGAVLVSAEVERILTGPNGATGVRMAGGREIRARSVISDAGVWNTFRRLLPDDTPGLEDVRDEMERIPPSTAHLCLYVGLEGTARELGLEATNLFCYPDADHDGNVRRYAAGPSEPFPSVYISSPSAKDPDFERRHPGLSTLEVVTVAPYAPYRRWEGTGWMKRGPEYEALKESLAGRLLEEALRRLPAARGRVRHAELSTPLSTRHFTGSPQGEMYGLAHTPARFQSRRFGPRTPVRNLFLTGQDACVCGVTGALMGGVLAASAVLNRNLLPAVLKG